MNQIFDVVIVGGGVVGLCATLAMHQRGFSVALVDAGSLKVDTSAIDPRVYALNQASQSLLDTLGVWALIDKSRMSPYQHMHVWDAANGAKIEFDARMIASSHLGTILEEAVIKQALLQKMALDTIPIFPQHRISEVQCTPDAVCLRDGSQAWQAKLLIVADGAESAVRQLLGIATTRWSYHQDAIVTLIRTEKPHQHTAYQVFNTDGPLAFLPLADAHLCSIVWSTTTKHARFLMNLSDEAFTEQLQSAFADKLGKCSVVDKRYSFPLHMRHAKQYSGARWLLMGDAAHTVHPLAGLGLNIGLADLQTWLMTLDNTSLDKDLKRKLGTYQRQRKHAVWKMIAVMEGLKMLFAHPLSSVVVLRGLGLRVCDRVSFFKRFFIEQAAG